MGALFLLPFAQPQSRKTPLAFLFFSKLRSCSTSLRFRRPLSCPPPPAAMAPKSTKGKGVAKDAGATETPESALAVQRTQSAFFPSTVDVFELRESFRPLWGVKTGGENLGHPATRVIPADCAEAAPNRYPFFVDFFLRALSSLLRFLQRHHAHLWTPPP